MVKKNLKFENFFKNSKYWQEWKNVDPDGGLETILIKKLIRKIGKHKRIKILDLACGHGRLLVQLSSWFDNLELYGLDINKNAVAITNKVVPKAKIVTGSVYKLPYPDNFFDIVVVAASFMHFEKPKKALREMARVSNKWIFFDLSTKTNISELLRNLNIMGRSSVPEKRYDFDDIKNILPNGFKWTIRGYSLFSHKLLTRTIYKKYIMLDYMIPKLLLNKIGHTLVVYGEKEN